MVSIGQGNPNRNGVAITPSITSDNPESITRDTVITPFTEMGIEVVECDLNRSEFYDASEAFFCDTGGGKSLRFGAPVVEGKPGELTRKLQQAYFDLTIGVIEDTRDWLTGI